MQPRTGRMRASTRRALICAVGGLLLAGMGTACGAPIAAEEAREMTTANDKPGGGGGAPGGTTQQPGGPPGNPQGGMAPVALLVDAEIALLRGYSGLAALVGSGRPAEEIAPELSLLRDALFGDLVQIGQLREQMSVASCKAFDEGWPDVVARARAQHLETDAYREGYTRIAAESADTAGLVDAARDTSVAVKLEVVRLSFPEDASRFGVD